MEPLPAGVTDAELIALVDRRAALLEREDYEAAFALTDHVPEMRWTPAQIREAIKTYSRSAGSADPAQTVTLEGVPDDVRTQTREVDRWPENARGCLGENWYDLNMDGGASDLTAAFQLRRAEGGAVTVHLSDIHVM